MLAELVLSSTLDPLTDGKRLLLFMPATKRHGSHGLAPCQIHLPAMCHFAEHSKECVAVALMDEGEDTLRQLSGVVWPHLSFLVISSNRIGSDAFVNLMPNNLPFLNTFTIRARHCDTQTVLHLAKGLPRMLSSLLLMTDIDVAAANHLSSADWPYLARLHIHLNMYKSPGVQSLDAASVQKLAQGQWPLLEVLTLRCNDLDQCAIGHLIQGRWPMLRKLALDSKCMTEAVCGMRSIVDILDHLQAMQCEVTKSGFGGRFQLKRLSSTIWPLLQDVCVVWK